MWVWVVAELVDLGHWDGPHQKRGRASSPTPMMRGGASALEFGVGMGGGAVLLLQ